MKVEMPCFVMVSFDNVIVTQSIEELISAIYHRNYFHCEVAVLNELAEAERYAIQKYYATFYANPFLTEVTPMPLPTPASNQFYNLKSHRLTTETHWAVEAINGYAVASDLNMLAYFLTQQGFIYPRAVAYQNEILAGITARAGFINRFAKRYGFESESLENLPIIASGNYFVDEFHQERELRRVSNSTMQNLSEFGLL